jgi:predicted phage tail protein
MNTEMILGRKPCLFVFTRGEKMNNKKFGILLIVVAVIMIALDFLAPVLNIGGAGFGWKKAVLLVVGVVVLAAGIMLSVWKNKKK